MPQLGDNALLKLAPLLAAMGDAAARLRRHRGPAALLLEGLGVPLDGDPGAALEALRERDPLLALLRRADARRDVRADAWSALGRRST